MKNINKFVIILSALVLILVGVFIIIPSVRKNPDYSKQKISPSASEVSENKEVLTYQGKNDINALALLKEKTEVVQDDSGLVTSVNGRLADPSKREFWSFYVNGEMANVGPADYVTKDTDTIEWKIESY